MTTSLVQQVKLCLARFGTLFVIVFCFSMSAQQFSPLLFDSLAVERAGFNIIHRHLGGSPSENTTEHATTEHSGGSHSIFGSLVQIDTKIYTIMILIIVGVVLFVEHLFLSFHEMSMDTPFHKMINAIEQELMNVGCTAFIFKIFLNSDSSIVNQEVFFALEFADILVPLFAFCNCIVGVVLIYASIKQCEVWSKAFHLKLDELLDAYLDEMTTWTPWNALWRWWFPSQVQAEIEFRIKHGIFCDMFKLQRNAFAFDEYVNCVFEKYVLLVIKISPMNWIGLCVCLVLNYARESLHITFKHCSHEHPEAYIDCKEHSYTQAYISGGVLLYVTTLVLWWVSYYYESMIISNIGIKSKEHYIPFLKTMEQKEQRAKKARRYNQSQIKEAVNKAKIEVRKRSIKAMHGQEHVDKAKQYWGGFKKHLRAVGRFLQGTEDMAEGSYRASNFRDISVSSKVRADSMQSDKTDSGAVAVGFAVESSSSSEDESCITRYSAKKSGDGGSSSSKGASRKSRQSSAPRNTLINQPITEGDDERSCPRDTTAAVTRFSPPDGADDVVPLSPNSAHAHAAEQSVTIHGPYTFQPAPTTTTTASTTAAGPTAHRSFENSVHTAQAIQDMHLNMANMNDDNTKFTATDRRVMSPKRGSVFGAKATQSILMTGQWMMHKIESVAAPRALKEIDWKAFISQKGKHVQSVFLFSNPDLYFSIVQFIILFISFYNALWLVNFCAINTPAWRVYTLLPGILSAITYVYIVKKAALLKALYQLDHDALLQVIERNEDRQVMLQTTRTKLLERLVDGKGDSAATIYNLFHELDQDDSNKLSRKEFEAFMSSLDLTFSKRKWKQIFLEIDCNFDDNISFEEFFLFLFPNHDVAKAMEIRRLKKIKNNVDKKAILLAERRNQHGGGGGKNAFNYKSFHGDLESSKSSRTAGQMEMIQSMKKGVVGKRLLNIAAGIKNRSKVAVTTTTEATTAGDEESGNVTNNNSTSRRYAATATAAGEGKEDAGEEEEPRSSKSFGMAMEDV